jgi:hypothetical protein
MGERGMRIGYWWESQKEREQYECHYEDGWIILKWVLDGMGWYGLNLSGSG